MKFSEQMTIAKLAAFIVGTLLAGLTIYYEEKTSMKSSPDSKQLEPVAESGIERGSNQ